MYLDWTAHECVLGVHGVLMPSGVLGTWRSEGLMGSVGPGVPGAVGISRFMGFMGSGGLAGPRDLGGHVGPKNPWGF